MAAPNGPPLPHEHLPPVAELTVTSDDIEHGEALPNAHVADVMGCTGENLSPHLHWEGAPEGTQSYAVTCFDPDAPTGSGFWHWVVFDIPVSVNELPRGAGSDDKAGLPGGAKHARNDLGAAEYVGSAPPPGHGDHRYVFTVHALGVPTLDIDADASAAIVGFNLTFNTLARGSIVATYGR
jgi:Raf kinase inhibitor-like YbhB/YbcL family protein